MADPYKTLGVARDASEADIKKAYRKLAKELHPDRNKGNPKASERFSLVTNAYDLLTDKEKRARFDRGEIDGDGNPAAPFGYGAGRPQSGGAGFRSQGYEGGGAGGEPDMSDIFEGLFGGAQRGGGGFASSFGRRPPPRGANIAYSLQVPFIDAAMLSPQRVTLGDGKTIDLKLPAGVETGTQMKLAGKGRALARRCGGCDHHDRGPAAPFPGARRRRCPDRPPDHAGRGGAGRHGESADGGEAGDADGARGHEFGQDVAAEGKGFSQERR